MNVKLKIPTAISAVLFLSVVGFIVQSVYIVPGAIGTVNERHLRKNANANANGDVAYYTEEDATPPLSTEDFEALKQQLTETQKYLKEFRDTTSKDAETEARVTDTKTDKDKNSESFRPQRDYYDACIVGAGLSGVVIAEQYASQLSKNSIIIEKRSHIGGNVYDYIDEETNILVNKYGAHLFHTNYPRVWDYIQQFSEWAIYEHRVQGFIEDKYVPIPVNIDTVNALFDLSISNKTAMDEWLNQEQVHNDNPQNSEEMALSRVGQRLYELIFEPYTFKQWAKTPQQLGPEVTARIPVRNNWDDRYFDDVFQALPKQGYTKFVQRMLNHPNIEVHVNTDYFDVKSQLEGKCAHTYYSGPIDQYFADLGYEKLEYRSINFERQVIKDIGTNTLKFPASVVNYPGAQYNFTRVVEYKHFLKQKSDHSVLFYERSTHEGDP